jgi:hypothetical protein
VISGSGIPFGRGAWIRNSRHCGNRSGNCCSRDGRSRGRGDYNESSKRSKMSENRGRRESDNKM